MRHKVLDLFSGIGGFSLGLQNTGGFETVAFCEIEPFCHKVLKKHWQDVPIYNDIKELTYEKMQANGIEPDVITGGFPCQDISVAGRQKGIIGERSSLWSEYARLIEDVRPTWAIIENVSALRSKGLTLVLQNLSEIGYNAEWHSIPCTAVGGLHRRDRIWIIAYKGNVADSHSGCSDRTHKEVRARGKTPDDGSAGAREATDVGNTECNGSSAPEIRGGNEETTGRTPQGTIQTFKSTGTGGFGDNETMADSNSRHGYNEEEEVRTGREAIDSSSY